MVGLIPCSLKAVPFEWSTLAKKGVTIPAANKASQHYANPNWGGPGIVSGTLKIGPVPVKRIVRLYEAATGVLVRFMWANDDGSYSFPGLKKDYKYTVTATDYTNNYNDVIAANVTAI